MSIVQKVVNRPTSVIIVFAIIVGLGLYVLGSIPIDQFPQIESNTIMVNTTYSGAGPEDVEKSVTRTLEGALVSVSGLETISSTSSEGSSRITLEFSRDTDLAEATDDIRDALERVRNSLPDGTETPQIFKFDATSMPILQLAVKGNRTLTELREIAETVVQPKLEQVEGVAITNVRGGKERVIRVEIAQDRLEAYRLTVTEVAAGLSSQNIQVAGGNFTQGDRKYVIRTVGEFASIEDIANAVVAYAAVSVEPGRSSSQPILLRDIATVYDGFEDTDNIVYMDGQPGVYIAVQKQSGTNSVGVADKVIKRMKELNKSGLPRGIELFVVRDMTTQTKDSIANVTTSAYLGGIFAVAILFFFLRRIKSTLIVAISIPISILITVVCMYFMGITLNISSLTGMALGVGMIVDNSIVIIENIFRYRERGTKIRTAAILGSREMINAIVASTTTTICVFLPLLLFRNRLGRLGMLFNDTSFTVIASIVASLLIAMILVPVLASKYLPLVTRRQKQIRIRWLRAIDDFMERMFTALDDMYKRALAKVLSHKSITVLVVVGCLLGTLTFIPKLGLVLMIAPQENSVMLNVEMPQGTPLEKTLAVLQGMETVIREEVTFTNIITTAGEAGFFGGGTTNEGSITVNLPPFEKRVNSSDEVKQILRKHFNDFPGAVFSFGMGGFSSLGGSDASIAVKTDNIEKGKATAKQILAFLKASVPEILDPSVDINDALPEYKLFIDRGKANALGVDSATVGNEIKANLKGVTATTYRTGGNEYDVFVVLREEDRQTLPDLEKIFVKNKSGTQVTVANFAHFEKGFGPVEILRENQSRIITVSGTFAPGASVDKVRNRVQTLIDANIIPDDDVTIELTGSFAEVNTYGFELVKIILMAFLLVFGVMAIQFESFKDPFIILFTIPLMAIGVIGIHIISGEALSMFSLVGIVMLLGIVVNNGIVLVDYTNLLVKRGMPVRDACINAGGNRLRPILMTTLTTILGMIPVAFFEGESSSLWQPFGKTVIGGLTTSTLMTLFFIPVLYALFNEKHARKKTKKSLEVGVSLRGGKR